MCGTGYEIARYKGTQASHLYGKSLHTLCTISEQPLLNYPRPKSITHLRIFSDNGVYVALIYMHGDDSPNIRGTNSLTWYPSHERYSVSNVDSQIFTPWNLVAQPEISPQTFALPGTCI